MDICANARMNFITYIELYKHLCIIFDWRANTRTGMHIIIWDVAFSSIFSTQMRISSVNSVKPLNPCICADKQWKLVKIPCICADCVSAQLRGCARLWLVIKHETIKKRYVRSKGVVAGGSTISEVPPSYKTAKITRKFSVLVHAMFHNFPDPCTLSIVLLLNCIYITQCGKSAQMRWYFLICA